MNDRDILRHERFDRFSTFGIENYPDLPVGCEAIVRFANIATFSGNFNRFCRLPAEPTERNIKTHTDSLLARLEDAPSDTPAQLAEKAPLRAKFIGKLTPADFVEDLPEAIDGKKLTNTSDNLKSLESTDSISVLLARAHQGSHPLRGYDAEFTAATLLSSPPPASKAAPSAKRKTAPPPNPHRSL
jgi:hypothetical protein